MQKFQYLVGNTPQTEPIRGSNQIANNAGGFFYPVDNWARLSRFLVLGTENGTYYVSERDLTKENVEAIILCIKEDGVKVVDKVIEISEKGRAAKNDPALFVLALVITHGDNAAKKHAFSSLHRVARMSTHLFHFLQYVTAYRGWGRGLREAVSSWYNASDPMDLAYQFVKYQQRDGWSHVDAIRLAHPKAIDASHNLLYKYVLRDSIPEGLNSEILNYLQAVERVKVTSNPKEVAMLINVFRLPREVVPTNFLNDVEVWQSLLNHMPTTAMVRNLATMTKVGLLGPLHEANKLVIGRLQDTDALRKARIHPMQLLAALRTYSSGKGIRGTNSWEPDAKIVDALNDAFYDSFQFIKPTGKNMLLAIDISGSMTGSIVNGIPGMSAYEAAAAMAMVIANTEPNYQVVLFNTHARPFAVSSRQRLDDILKSIRNEAGGGTDCAAPIHWAQNRKDVRFDGFIILTDSETWAGIEHPSEALVKYRRLHNASTKLATVAMVANGGSISDNKDAGMIDVVGFDTQTPQIVTDFIGNRLF